MTTDADSLIRSVGRRVAELRAAAGLTQADLAEQVGVSIQYLQRIEAGAENLTLRSLVRLANVLETEVGELLRPATSPPPGRGRPPMG